MKRLLLTAAVLASTLMPITASASDRFHGSSRGHDYGSRGGYYGGRGYYGGHDRGYYRGGSSFNFSFGLFGGGSRYYEPYYRPVYRSYYPPPAYYYDEPVYVPAPVYIAPPRRYYDDDCYYRPSSSLSFSYGRYYYR
ncbi:MAG: hypothetical protein JWN40_1200 [Phycisphaerales bacterium]|nr:hypothetical protein [Phycisphaerales bacterium]